MESKWHVLTYCSFPNKEPCHFAVPMFCTASLLPHFRLSLPKSLVLRLWSLGNPYRMTVCIKICCLEPAGGVWTRCKNTRATCFPVTFKPIVPLSSLHLWLLSSVGNSTTVLEDKPTNAQDNFFSFDTDSSPASKSSPSSLTWIGQTSRRFHLPSSGSSSLVFSALVTLPGVYNMNTFRVLAKLSEELEPGGSMVLQKPCPPSFVVVESTSWPLWRRKNYNA